MCGELRAVALCGFGDMRQGIATAVGHRRNLLTVALNLRRRVDEGLAPTARRGDVELLLVHRGAGHDEGLVNSRPLRRIGRHGVGVFECRGVGVWVGSRQVVGTYLDLPRRVDAVEDNAALLRVDLGDPPALAVVAQPRDR